MHITQISAINMKGRNFSVPLSPANLICGDNFSHKTAILDAIMLGLLGYHPRLAKTNQGTWELAGKGKELGITLGINDGTIVQHTWTHGKSISYKGGVPTNVAVPAELLHTRSYLEKTGADRIKYVFERISLGPDFDEKELFKQLSVIEVLNRKISEPIINSVNSLLAKNREVNKTSPFQQWLLASIDQLKTYLKTAKDNAKSQGEELSRLKNSRPDHAADPSTEVTVAKSKRDKLLQLISGLEMALRAQQQAAESIAKSKRVVDEYKLTPEQITRATEEVKFLTEQNTAATEALNKISPVLREMSGKFQAITTDINNLGLANENLEADLKKILESPACEHCGKKPAWIDEAVKERQDQVLANSEAIKLKLGEKAALEVKHSELDEELERFQDIVDSTSKLQEKRAELQEMINASSFYQNAKQYLENTKAIDSADTGKLPQLKQELQELNEAISKLEIQWVTFTTYTNWQNQHDRCETNSVQNAVTAECYQEFVNRMQLFAEGMVSDCFNKLLSISGRMTNGILRADLQFKDNELGMHVDGSWVNYKTFSGTEELIAFAGLSVALCQSSPIKLVLMDELGRLDQKSLTKLLGRILELIEWKVIDQFVGVIAGEAGACLGFNVIRL